MDFAFSEEQEMLRRTARAYLDEHVPISAVRRLMETDEGYDPGVWQEIARQGWTGLHIPEEYGGSGYGFLELAVVMEEMGRSLFPGPFLSSAVLAGSLILQAGSEAQKRSLLPAIASGEKLITPAVVEAGGGWGPDGIVMRAEPTRDGYRLAGTKHFVLDGHVADTLLVAARTGDAPGSIALFVIDATSPNITRRRLETMDMTRKQAEVVLDGVEVSPGAMLGDEGSGWPALEVMYDLAAVALAAEQVGGAAACLEMAVDYAKNRVQFGRPIGSFQAVKHKCADMLVAVESARSAAYYAARAASADPEELRLVAPLAKAFCSEAYFSVAAETIQVHGGIGFTWEHDAHLYFKRAKSSELLFGDPAYHRAMLADRLGL